MEMKILDDGTIGFMLDGYGSLVFEPYAKTDDKQRYSAKLKVNSAFIITGEMMANLLNHEKGHEFICISGVRGSIQSMIKSLENLEKEIYNSTKAKENGNKTPDKD